MADFNIKQNDTLPFLAVQFFAPTTSGGVTAQYAIPDGAVIRFVMRRQNDKSIVVNSTNVQVLDSTNGIVKYQWQPGDTAEQGLYDIEFEMSVGGQRVTFPNDSYRTVEILADLITQ